MSRRNLAHSVIAVLAVLWACLVPAFADSETDISPPPTIASDVTPADVRVVVEGQAVETQAYLTDQGEHYLDADPILSALDNHVRFLDGVLHVTRSQDKVTMSLFTETGLVQADGKDLGHLRHYGRISPSEYLLTPNTLAILTGTHAKFDEKTKTYDLELDARLKVVTGFNILVEGISLQEVDPQPRAVGPVLLLPLRPIAEALGHDVVVVEGGASVEVRRAQDSALFRLDFDSGLLSLSGKPIGVSRDIAFVEADTLLLPATTIETLTGTHISTEGGIVEVDLDSRLSGVVEAGLSVEEIVADTPFTPESLTFSLGPRQVNRVSGDFRWRGVNGRARLEIQDMPDEFVELEPSWLSLDFEHISGTEGSIGDIYARHRETASVGSSRLRGVRAERRLETGHISAVIGTPVRGSRRISDDQSRLTFDGVAAGARWKDDEGWEAGLAVAHDPLTDDQRAVLSAISQRLGTDDLALNVNGALGVFNGPDRSRPVDARLSVSAQQRVTPQLDVTGFASYTGVEFQRSLLTDEARERERALDEAERNLGVSVSNRERDARRAGADTAEYGVDLRWRPKTQGFLRAPAISVSAAQQRSGVTTDGIRLTRNRVSAGAATSLGDTGVGVNLGVSAFDISGRDVAGEPVDQSGRSFRASAFKRFNDFDLRGDYENSWSSGDGTRETATLSVTPEGFDVRLPKGAAVSVAPSARLTSTDGRVFLQGSAVAQLDSGQVFGPKNRVGATFGVVQAYSEQFGLRTQTFLTVDAARRIRIGENMALGLGYATDLKGTHSIGLNLTGRYDFAKKRRLARTEPDSGILTGQAFFDRNRDGIKQDDEPGLPGIGIQLENTPWRLRADGNGAFTVRNLKKGLYDVRIIGQTLPLGFAQSSDAKARVSIQNGRVTDLRIPVVQRGQLRGFLFVDSNGNGTYDKGETRPEGVRIEAEGPEGEVSIRSSTFGQYAFDDLVGGTYTITQDGLTVAEIDLTEFDSLMGKVQIPIPPRDVAGADPPIIEDTEGAGPPEPAP